MSVALGVVVSLALWFLGGCTTPVSAPNEIHHDDQAATYRQSDSEVTVSFETTAANRDKARAAGVPVLLHGDAVNYPATVDPQTTGNGWVNVIMIINTDGSVDSARVLDSSNPVFENAALHAIRSWKFAPAPHPQTLRHRIVILASQRGDHYQPTTIDH